MAIVSAIVCIQKNGGIGYQGDLIYGGNDLPLDMKRFIDLTRNKVVIMGRLTWEGLRKHPLPGRVNVVLSSQKEFKYSELADKIFNQPLVVALIWAQRFHKDKDIVVIGGGKTYEDGLPYFSHIDVTEVDYERPADCFFKIPLDKFAKTENEPQTPGESGIPYSFTKYILREKRIPKSLGDLDSD